MRGWSVSDWAAVKIAGAKDAGQQQRLFFLPSGTVLGVDVIQVDTSNPRDNLTVLVLWWDDDLWDSACPAPFSVGSHSHYLMLLILCLNIAFAWITY